MRSLAYPALIQLFFVLHTAVRASTASSVDGNKTILTGGDPPTADDVYDFSPCTSDFFNNQLRVYCTAVPSFSAVQAAFRRQTIQYTLTEFVLNVPLSEVNNSIPADLLSQSVTKKIRLYGQDTSTQIKIDPEAFKSSKDYTLQVEITDANLSRLNYSFLIDFTVLTQLSYTNVVNISPWLDLPVLPSLSKLSVASSPEFQGFDGLPVSKLTALDDLTIRSCQNFQFLPNVSPPLMTTLLIESCPLFQQWDAVVQLSRLNSISLIGLAGQTILEALDAFASSSLVGQLTSLTLTQNGLTELPKQVTSFSKLRDLYLSGNQISTATNGSLAFITPGILDLSLASNNLSIIEPATFQGNFSTSQIYLENNKLTQFEEFVFKPILEQMEKTDRYGRVYLSNNPIDCNCHLKWLIVDNPNLVDRVAGGACTGGYAFEWLEPSDFASCNQTPPTVSTTLIPTTSQSTNSSGTTLHSSKYFNLIHWSIFMTTVMFLNKM